MRRISIVLATLFLLAGFLVVSAGHVLAKDMVQEKCPVMGSTPNEKLFTDYKGKRVYFCCPPCIDQFKENPDKYMGAMQFQGIQLEDAPTEE